MGGGGVGGRGGLPIMAYTGRLCPKSTSLRIGHSKFFSTVDMDKQNKPLEMIALKLVKLPSLKIIALTVAFVRWVTGKNLVHYIRFH